MKIYKHSPHFAGEDSVLKMQQILSKSDSLFSMTREQLHQLQEKRLQDMLIYAKKHAPWYNNRFSNIHPNQFKLEELSQLPIMTKRDLMNNWNDIVTDQRLKLDKAQAFLMSETGYNLLYGHHLFASGGSSGRRGLFVWNADEIAITLAGFYRYQYRDEFKSSKPDEHLMVASVAATLPVHLSQTVFAMPIVPHMKWVALSALDPIDELMESLNYFNPTHLNGYPSVITRLASQALKGHLMISPKRILVGAEPLLANMISLMKKAWPKVVITNGWGSTDAGAHAESCDYSNGNLHLNEDLVIIEPVDESNNPTPPGERSAKILVTNLHRKSMPIFRYEMDDIIMPLETNCACGSPFKLIQSIEGRHEEDFVYGGVIVMAEMFENIIMPEPNIDEYQVFQTPNGADIWIVPEREKLVRTHHMKTILEHELCQLGLDHPEVNVKCVEKLKRHPETGKLKRFHCSPKAD